MSEDLSRIVTELFAKPMDGKELSSQIQRLGEEIRKIIQGDTIFGKFRGLLESFREIIPDEQQRYLAALKALSTTSKLNPQEIKKALASQLEELKILEKGLVPTQHAWHDSLKGIEARSQQVKGEAAQLRAQLAQLESEEKALQAHLSVQEKDLALAEKTVRELFATILAEISSFNKKVAEFTADAPAAQPLPPPARPSPSKELLKNDAPGKDTGGVQAVGKDAPPPPQDAKYQRKCPMCGGAFNLLELENIWQCYTCAYQEPNR
jgi:chromosome segregation ATPase